MAFPIRSRAQVPDPNVPYKDTGALVITDTTHRPNSIAYKASICGVSNARELLEAQSAFHKAFGKLPGLLCTSIICQHMTRATDTTGEASEYFRKAIGDGCRSRSVI